VPWISDPRPSRQHDEDLLHFLAERLNQDPDELISDNFIKVAQYIFLLNASDEVIGF
jgi:hypothetical protein